MYELKDAVKNFFAGKADDRTVLLLGAKAGDIKKSEFYIFWEMIAEGLKSQVLEDAYINGKNKTKSAEMLLGELSGFFLFSKVLDDFIVRAGESLKKQEKSKDIETENDFVMPYTEPPDIADASTMV